MADLGVTNLVLGCEVDEASTAPLLARFAGERRHRGLCVQASISPARASQASSAAGEISKSRSGDRETARVDPAGAESGSRAVKRWEQMPPSVVVGGQAATMEGSAHDASILSGSLSMPDGLQIPEGKFYLGDDVYACRSGILPPLRKTRYHLNEFTASNRPKNVKTLFKLRHSRLRVTIEKAFASLKNKFKVGGEDDFFEEVVTFDEVETGHGVEADDNEVWKEKRLGWANTMWEARCHTTM
ncbi:hypothetical protein QYE76_001839 [Lolium multiflorum]|uniref:DDE Tnp4 domain-containing protein n=1 Tax=Lolium multiflorum TaxID=4521 RepID=A0AAD8RLX5_LOLMU|nr:hypothetical protein QYE76_001839 [Lolium multiflorum]